MNEQRKRLRRTVGTGERVQQTLRFTRYAMALIEAMMRPGVMASAGLSMGDVIETAIFRFNGPK
jgi:hypothetical protein